QADHDLAIGERGVVVGNLAQPGRCGIDVVVDAHAIQGKRCVHRRLAPGYGNGGRAFTSGPPCYRSAANPLVRAAGALPSAGNPRDRGRAIRDRNACVTELRHTRALLASHTSHKLHGDDMNKTSLALAALAGGLLTSQAQAQVEIQWWHSMTGAL